MAAALLLLEDARSDGSDDSLEDVVGVGVELEVVGEVKAMRTEARR